MPRLFSFSWEKSFFIVIFAVITSFFFGGGGHGHCISGFWFPYFCFLYIYLHWESVTVHFPSSFVLMSVSVSSSQGIFFFPTYPLMTELRSSYIVSSGLIITRSLFTWIILFFTSLTDDPGHSGLICVPVFVNCLSIHIQSISSLRLAPCLCKSSYSSISIVFGKKTKTNLRGYHTTRTKTTQTYKFLSLWTFQRVQIYLI